MLEFDEEASRAVERVYGTADVVEQRRLVMAAPAPRPGERALDLGCRPGLLACELARAVGPGGRVLGLDASPSMLAMAAARCGVGRRRSRSPRPTSRGRCRWRRRGRPGRLDPGLRVRRGRRGRPGGGTARPAPRRPPARARHRLGLDRLAVARRPPHGPGAGRLGRAPGPPRPSAPAALALRVAGSRSSRCRWCRW